MNNLKKVLYFSMISFLITNCQTPKKASASIVESLSNLEAKYILNTDSGDYIFNAKPKIESLIENEDKEKLIKILVENLDNEKKSSSTLNGNSVITGMICYEALTQIIYYEPTNAEGDISSTWEGTLKPDASIAQINAAKKAWKSVIESRSFIFQ